MLAPPLHGISILVWYLNRGNRWELRFFVRQSRIRIFNNGKCETIGNGLFTARAFKDLAPLTYYDGPTIQADTDEEREALEILKTTPEGRSLMYHGKQVLNGALCTTGGQFANDNRGSGMTATLHNSSFNPDVRGAMTVRAKGDMGANEEVTIDYGTEYWLNIRDNSAQVNTDEIFREPPDDLDMDFGILAGMMRTNIPTKPTNHTSTTHQPLPPKEPEDSVATGMLAFSRVGEGGDQIIIDELFVHDENRGEGIAGLLFNQLVTVLHSVDRVHLIVREHAAQQVKARRFFKKMGFIRTAKSNRLKELNPSEGPEVPEIEKEISMSVNMRELASNVLTDILRNTTKVPHLCRHLDIRQTPAEKRTNGDGIPPLARRLMASAHSHHMNKGDEGAGEKGDGTSTLEAIEMADTLIVSYKVGTSNLNDELQADDDRQHEVGEASDARAETRDPSAERRNESREPSVSFPMDHSRQTLDVCDVTAPRAVMRSTTIAPDQTHPGESGS